MIQHGMARSGRADGIRIWAALGGVLFAGALGCVAAGTGAQGAAAEAGPALVFDGATVVDVERGTLVPAQRVVIVGTRIRAVGDTSRVTIPAGARVVDARGKYLMPGLWDMHVHTRAYLPSYLLLLANGVTGFRDAGGYVPLDTMIRWRREIAAGTRVGPPRQILSGQSINSPMGKGASWWQVMGDVCRGDAKEEHRPDRMKGWAGYVCVTDSAQVRALVDSLKAKGVDMIKLRAVARPLWYVAAAEARRLRIPFGGHSADNLTPLEAADSGETIIDHSLGGSACESDGNMQACQEAARRFRRAGLWFVPTPNDLGRQLEGVARKFWAGAPIPDDWLRTALGPDASSDSSMVMVQRVDLPLLIGTDTDVLPVRVLTHPQGFALHLNLATYVAEGMTPAGALRTATLNPAKFLHATDSLGTVAPGKLADLVLLDADPLAEITNTTRIRAVVANGRYFDRVALDGLLAEVREGAKRGFVLGSDGKADTVALGRRP